jgi:PHS family inorganic phosphate transporter-like MFS transporter
MVDASFPQQNGTNGTANDPDGLFRTPQVEETVSDNDDDDNDQSYSDCGCGCLGDMAQMTAMISNYSTSYNVVNISMVLPILKAILTRSNDEDTTNPESSSPSSTPYYHADAVSAVASTLLAGMMIGQVLGGALGDALGNVWIALNLAMLLQIMASLGSAVFLSWEDNETTIITTTTTSPDTNNDAYAYDGLFWRLAAWRFVLGIGAGAVYPLAASLSAQVQQSSPTTTTTNTYHHHHHLPNTTPTTDLNMHEEEESSKKSLQRVVWTFSTQGMGFVSVPLVAVTLLYTTFDLQTVAKLILGLGSVPGIGLLSWQILTHQRCRQCCCFCCFCKHCNHFCSRICCCLGQTTQRQPIPIIDEDAEEEETTQNETNHVVEESHPESSAGAFDSRPVDSRRMPLEDVDEDATERAIITMDHHHHYAGNWWDAIWHEEQLMAKLLGTACTWFLFDVLFYGNTLFQPIVIEAVLGPSHHREDGDSGDNVRTMLQSTARDSMLLTSIALPGYFVAGYLLGKTKKFCYCGIWQTPRFVMLQGFAAMAILYLIIGVGWKPLQQYPTILIILYSLTFFFANYGPNTTTFVLPSMVYSPQCRSTLNGICAAAGKFGALVGASFFAPAADSLGNASVMILCAFVAMVAYLMTVFFVPSSLPNDHPEESLSVGEEEEDVGHHHPPLAPLPTTPPSSTNGVNDRTIV